MYSNMRTTITPVPMSSPKTSTHPQLSSKTTMTPIQPATQILPTLTDDMYVVEAPSFIVPYVYEKSPIGPLREFITKLDKCIQERNEEDRKREEAEEAKEKDNDVENKDDDKKSEVIIFIIN